MKVLAQIVLLVSLFAFRADASINYLRALNLGDSGTTTVYAMTTDAAGNLYLTGGTTNPSLPVTAGAVQPKIGPGSCTFIFDPHSPPISYPCSDAFVMKLDAGGSMLFLTYLGGSGTDIGQAIAVDSAGNIYVAGQTGSLDFPITPGTPFVNEATVDGFVTKLNPQGTAMIYSAVLPGAPVAAIALDASGDVVVGGSAQPSEGLFTATPGAYQTTTLIGHSHSVVTKLNAAATKVMFATWVGGSKDDGIQALTLDAAGNIYLAGSTNSPDYPITPGAPQATLTNVLDTGFVTKLNSSGSTVMYSTYLGGSNLDGASRIGVDAQGNAYVGGATFSTDFPVTAGAFETMTSPALWSVTAPTYHYYVTKVNSQGTALAYSTLFDAGQYMTVDAAGNVYLAGQVSYGFPTTHGATRRCNAGAWDVLLAQLDPTGALAAASYLGGSASDAPQAIALAANGTVFVAGNSNSPEFPGYVSGENPQLFAANLQIANPTQADTPCMALVAQNGANFIEEPIAPGELITLRGLGFGPDQGTQMQLVNGAISNNLAGVTVTFDGVPAPLLYVQSQQINVQAPWELSAGGATKVQVQYGGAASNTATFQVAQTSPGLFYRFDGTNEGAIINQDGTVNSAANPAPRGTIIAVYGTGGGALNLPGVTGGLWPLAPLSYISAQPVTAYIAGYNVLVAYAGSAPLQTSGLFQVNVMIPATLPLTGSLQLNITVGTASSEGFEVKVAVQ